MIQSRLPRLTVLALGLVLLPAVGCGEAETVAAPTYDLAEPWRAQPFAVDPSTISAAEQVCRAGNVGIVPPGAQLVVVDARGANRLTLLFVGPRDNGQCFLARDPAGRLTTAGGEGTGSSEPWPALGPIELTFDGVGSQEGSRDPNDADVSSSHLIGRAGAAVAAVEVVLPSGGSLQASLNRGWFAAWWPGLDSDAVVGVRGYDAGGSLVGSSP